MAQFCASVTHIYYLASPAIARSESNRWERAQFTGYCEFYIDGLATLLQPVRHLRPDECRIERFIHSSAFLVQSVKGFDEYIGAKAAAEAFVRCFEKSNSDWQVVSPSAYTTTQIKPVASKLPINNRHFAKSLIN